MLRYSSLVICSSLVLLSACSGALVGDPAHVSGKGEIRGETHMAKGVATPSGIPVVVELVDLSSDVGRRVLASSTAMVGGEFLLHYEMGSIKPDHTYAVRARSARDEDGLISDKTAYVLTYGFPARARVRMAFGTGNER